MKYQKCNSCCTIKHLTNFWRSLEIPLINFKIELNLNGWSIVFCLKLVMIMLIILLLLLLYIMLILRLLSARDNQTLSKILSKWFQRSVYWNEYKTKIDNKKTNKFRYFLESNVFGFNRLFLLVYSVQDANSKRFTAKIYSLSKSIIKDYNVFIS